MGEGLSGPTNLTTTNIGAASFSLREALRQATANLAEGYRVRRMVMGVAGMDVPSEELTARQVFGEVISDYGLENFILVNDIVIALASGATQPNAVALIAGTGSNCYGRNDQGQEVRVGGMDYLLSDQGSGYEIGLNTLKAAVASFDGRINKSKIEEMICAHFQIKDIIELKEQVYNPTLSKSEVADLARLCQQAYEAGDGEAERILAEAVEGLVELVSTALRRLNLTEARVDLILVGGVTKFSYIYQSLDEKLSQICPKLVMIRPDKEPVYGALRMALKPW